MQAMVCCLSIGNQQDPVKIKNLGFDIVAGKLRHHIQGHAEQEKGSKKLVATSIGCFFPSCRRVVPLPRVVRL
jgi:hypothetical protein